MSSPPIREVQAVGPSHTPEVEITLEDFTKFGLKDDEAKYLHAHFSFMPTEAELYNLISRVTALPESRMQEIMKQQKNVTGRISFAMLKRECFEYVLSKKSALPTLPKTLKSSIKRGAYSGCWIHWQQWGTTHPEDAIRKHFEKNKIPITGPSFPNAISWVTRDIGDNFVRCFASGSKCRENVKQHVNALNYLIRLQQKIVTWALGSGEAGLYKEDLLDRHGETHNNELVYFIHL